MTFKTRMRLGLVLFLAVVLVWDAWLYYHWGYDATISGVIWTWQSDYAFVKWVALPVFIFMWYHWFWGSRQGTDK